MPFIMENTESPLSTLTRASIYRLALSDLNKRNYVRGLCRILDLAMGKLRVDEHSRALHCSITLPEFYKQKPKECTTLFWWTRENFLRIPIGYYQRRKALKRALQLAQKALYLEQLSKMAA